MTLSAGIAAATALPAAAGSTTPVAVTVLLLWGVAYGGLSVSAQAWMPASAPESREAVGALVASVFNAAIALGALAGGRVVDSTPLRTVLLPGAALSVCALVALALTRHTGMRSA